MAKCLSFKCFSVPHCVITAMSFMWNKKMLSCQWGKFPDNLSRNRRDESLTWRYDWWHRGRHPGVRWKSRTRGRPCPPSPGKTAPESGSAAAFQLAWPDAHPLWRWERNQIRGPVWCQMFRGILYNWRPVWFSVMNMFWGTLTNYSRINKVKSWEKESLSVK